MKFLLLALLLAGCVASSVEKPSKFHDMILFPKGWHPDGYNNNLKDTVWGPKGYCNGDVLYEAAPPSCIEVMWCWNHGPGELAYVTDFDDCGDFHYQTGDGRCYDHPLPACDGVMPVTEPCKPSPRETAE